MHPVSCRKPTFVRECKLYIASKHADGNAGGRAASDAQRSWARDGECSILNQREVIERLTNITTDAKACCSSLSARRPYWSPTWTGFVGNSVDKAAASCCESTGLAKKTNRRRSAERSRFAESERGALWGAVGTSPLRASE